MFLASLMFVMFALVSNQTQTIIESSAVIATSIAALVAALKASNKKKTTPARKTKPKAALPGRLRSDDSLNSNSM